MQSYYGHMWIKLPYVSKDTSTLLALSTAIVLLLASPLVLSNILLQPVQAQTPMSFRTTQPIDGTLECSRTLATLTFDAQGTAASDNQSARITSGTFQITSIRDGQKSASGSIHSGEYVNSSVGGNLGINGIVDLVHNFTSPCVLEKGAQLTMKSGCRTSGVNDISIYFLENGASFADFNGAVECSLGHTTQSSPSSSATGTTTQDSDGDGIPDSSDRCDHNSNQRCYKESK